LEMRAFKQIAEDDMKAYWHWRIRSLHIERDDSGLRYVDIHLPSFYAIFGISKDVICLGVWLGDRVYEKLIPRR